MSFDHHPSGMGVVLADGSFRCYDCISIRGEHRCHGADGAWTGAPACACPVCGFLLDWSKHESAPRTPCPDCQFESSEGYSPSHGPSCGAGGPL